MNIVWQVPVFLYLFFLTMAPSSIMAMAVSGVKPVLVTGANKGIGKAICAKLLKEYPETLILLGSRDEARGKAAVQDLTATLGEETVADRLYMVPLDTGSDDSVQAAVQHCRDILGDTKLYGICNNAGVLGGVSTTELINVNFYGPQRINNAFVSNNNMMMETEGRIVNMASGGAPGFVQGCRNSQLQKALTEPWSLKGGVEELNQLVESFVDQDAAQYPHQSLYGFSKASLNAYTWLLANQYPNLIVNSVSPGWVATDMTAGSAASKTPEEGAVPPVYLLMDEDVAQKPTGRYYGSDCKRSPYHLYRDPGEPEYNGPDGPKKEADALL